MKFTARIRKADGTERTIENIQYFYKNKESLFIIQEQVTRNIEWEDKDITYTPTYEFKLTETVEIIIIDEFNFEFYKEDWGL